MKVRRIGVAVRPPHALGEEIVFTLPAELVEEILLRVPPDDPAHLVRATVVCKAWHRILSDDAFCRRYRSFHGTVPLLGYICTHRDLTVRFVPTTTVAASPVRTPVLHFSGRTTRALDCRHGHVLIEANDYLGLMDDILVVWDPITGSQYNLSMPSFLQHPLYIYGAAVVCAKDSCDHLDCHGGPFLVVILVMSYVGGGDDDGTRTWASVYSSETCAWSAPTPNITKLYLNAGIPSLFIGDALYFATVVPENIIIKYDLRKHVLSVIDLPGQFWPILMKGDDGGLGFASILQNCIHMWSWRASINGNEEWVKYRVMDLDTQVPKDGCLRGLICMVDGTNTILIKLDKGIFTLDLKSEQVRKIGQTSTDYRGRILPYTSFYTPKY